MRVVRSLVAIVLSVFLLSLAGVKGQSFSPRSLNATASVERQIFKKINSLPYYGVFDHIAFEIVGGSDVVLYGKVRSLSTRRDAERVVSRIPGVRSVTNNISNLPPSSFDDQIRRSIIRNFGRTAGVYMYLRELSPSVRIIVENGRVTLEGYVKDRGTANLMNILANQAPGVFQVTNNLHIDSGGNR